MWAPVRNKEWDEDEPLDDTGRITTRNKEPELGSISFEGSTLPWTIGHYEVMSLASSLCQINLLRTKVRYHHDGKYNVLSLDGPFEVYGVYPTIVQHILI